MPDLEQMSADMAAWVWSVPLFFLLLGCGLAFSIFSKFVQWRILTHGYACIRGHYDKPDDTGHINHFQALCAALSATIGLGNIAGVALAISIGGPGAIFWMWIIGVFGMALKFMECSLATMFRDVREVPDPVAQMDSTSEIKTKREVRGGPMWYIQKALVDPLKERRNGFWVVFKVLAVLFAFATVLNSFGGGNMFQGWNVSDQLTKQFSISNPYYGAAVFSSLVAIVIIGGIKRIGEVASKLVPFMCIVYVAGALYVIIANASDVPGYLADIVRYAFAPLEEQGRACAGVTIWFAFKQGLRRACFSNEAGEGSAAMAHAAAKTEEPIREGVVAGIGPFVDTIIICTMSALVILISGAWDRPKVGDIASIDQVNNTAVVRCGGTLPDKMEPLYLSRLVADSNKKLAVQVVREMGKETETVSAKIISVDRGDGDGWAAIKSVTIDLVSDVKEKDRPKFAVDQHVHLDMDGAEMTGFAFDTTFEGFGRYMVTLAVCLFGFSTMISWSYYGETGAEYLLGPKAILPYKFLFVFFVFLGMVLPKFQTVYDFSDATTGLMVLFNLPAVLILSPTVIRAMKSYFRRLDDGEMPRER